MQDELLFLETQNLYRQIKNIHATKKVSNLNLVKEFYKQHSTLKHEPLNAEANLIDKELIEQLSNILKNDNYHNLIEFVNQSLGLLANVDLYFIGIIFLFTDDEEVITSFFDSLLRLTPSSFLTELELYAKFNGFLKNNEHSLFNEKLYNKAFMDNRGIHNKFYVEANALPLGFKGIKEVFMTTNDKGALRGLHSQVAPCPQQKIVKVANGRFNVRILIPSEFVDNLYFLVNQITQNHYNKLITYENGDVLIEINDYSNVDSVLYIPENIYWGYVALEDNSKMIYLADGDFSSECDSAYSPFSHNIDWGVDFDLIISDKDKNATLRK